MEIQRAHVRMDATAGIAIGSRRVLGRVKHIDTVFLWVQAMVTEGKVTLGKNPTKEMLATCRRCNVVELYDRTWFEAPVGLEQADFESVN